MARPKKTEDPVVQIGTVAFRRLKNVQCPACLDRNALNPVGLPIVVGGQLRGSSTDEGVMKLSAGCEVCGGRGRVHEAERVKGDWPPGDKWVIER